MADIREYVTLREIAARFAMSKNRAKQLAVERGITGHQIGNMTVFHESQVHRFAPAPRAKRAR